MSRRPAPRHRLVTAAAVAAAVLAGAGCGANGTASAGRTATPSNSPSTSRASAADAASTSAAAPARVARWRPAHIVVVVEENRSYGDIVGARDAPFLNRLAATGARLTRMYAVTHPSEPNYLALFSGSTHGLADDSCPHTFRGPNLAAQLAAAHRSFVGYAEGLPAAGAAACTAGRYARKHAPWTDFAGLDPAAVGRPLTDFPTDFTTLPTVAFVVPDLEHDMHDGSVAEGDAWLRAHLSSYATWARTHDSLLVVTWDEDDRSSANHIPSFVIGSHVVPGAVAAPADHYRLLRTIEWWLGLPGIGAAARRAPLTSLVRG